MIFVIGAFVVFSVLYKMLLNVGKGRYTRVLLTTFIGVFALMSVYLLVAYCLFRESYTFIGELVADLLGKSLTLEFDMLVNILFVSVIIIVSPPSVSAFVSGVIDISNLGFDKKKKELFVTTSLGNLGKKVLAKVPNSLIVRSLIVFVMYAAVSLLLFYRFVFNLDYVTNTFTAYLCFVVAIVTLVMSVLLIIDLEDLVKEVMVSLLFVYPDTYQTVSELFDEALENNNDLVLPMIEIDFLRKQFIEYGLFQSVFAIDFTKVPYEKYRLAIDEKVLNLYVAKKEEFS